VAADALALLNPKKECIIRAALHLSGKDLNFGYMPEDGYRIAKVHINGQVYLEGRIVNSYSGSGVFRAPAQDSKEIINGRTFSTSFDIPVSGPGSYELRATVFQGGQIGNVSLLVEVPDFTSPRLSASGIATYNISQEPDLQAGAPAVTRRIHRSNPFACSLFIYNASKESSGKCQIESQWRLYRDDKLVQASEVVSVNAADALSAEIPIKFEINPSQELTAGNYLLEVSIVDRLANKKNSTANQSIAIELVD